MRTLTRYAAAVAFTAAAWVAAEILLQVFGVTRLSMVFLGAILLAAVSLGMGPALLTAVLSFGLYNRYLRLPSFAVEQGSVEQFITLLMFLAVALMTGALAGRVRDEGVRSRARARTMAALFSASRALSSTDEEDAIRRRLSEQIAAATKGEAEVRYEDRVWSAGYADWGKGEPAEWESMPLIGNGVDFGQVRWRAPDHAGKGTEASGLIQVMADLATASLTQARLAAEKSRMETVAKTEHLRTALLSSISHDLRTPLTAILTSLESLLKYRDQFPASTQEDLLSTAYEEAERLDGYVAGLLSMIKLESGALSVQSAPVLVSEVVERMVQRFGRQAAKQDVSLITDSSADCVLGDEFLLEQVLANVVENAIRFSAPGGTVRFSSEPSARGVAIRVTDDGPGVPAGERELIFDKFYRVADPRGQRQGAGLGLSIARGMLDAMGGAIRAEGRPDGAAGLSVVIELPRPQADAR